MGLHSLLHSRIWWFWAPVLYSTNRDTIFFYKCSALHVTYQVVFSDIWWKQNTIKKDGSIMIVTVAILYHNNRTRKWIISYLGLWKFTEISISSMDEKSFPHDLMATAGGMPHFQTHTHTVVLYICTHNYIYIYKYNTWTRVFPLDWLPQLFPLRLLTGFIWITSRIADQLVCFTKVLIYSDLKYDPPRRPREMRIIDPRLRIMMFIRR